MMQMLIGATIVSGNFYLSHRIATIAECSLLNSSWINRG